jgi:GT2 family glycosyltransferase
MKELDTSRLRGKSLYIATPMYGNQCNGGYMQSVMRLQKRCWELGIAFEFYALFNESLITRARNACVHEFLKTNYTHMMFIDADIIFDPEDVLKMLASDLDVLCGIYSKKKIRWDRVMQAISTKSLNLGSTDKEIENFTGDFFFTPLPEKDTISLEDPTEILEAGTGFMMIKRETFDQFSKAHPQLKFISDWATAAWHNTEMVAFFDTIIDEKTKRYLSEDYMFCRHARAAGLKVWLCPWAKLEHVGSYTFKGKFRSTIDLLL